MPKMLGKIANAINAGTQSALQTYGSLQQLERQREQAKAQLEQVEAYKGQVKAQTENAALNRQQLASNLFNDEMSTIASLDPESQKAYVKTRFKFINDLAGKGNYAPFTNEDEVLNDVRIKPQAEAYANLAQARKIIPRINQGIATPQEIETARTLSSGAFKTLMQFNRHNEADYKNYQMQAAKFEEVFGKYEASKKPVAVADGQPITGEQFDTIKGSGNTSYQGIDQATGLPKVGQKPAEDKTDKTTGELFQLTQRGPLGELNKLRNTVSTVKNSISAFAQNPSGYSDYGTLMQSLKTLQGDTSVVREAEMRLGKGATSLINKAVNSLQEAIDGKSLQPSQRKQIIEVTNIMAGAYDNQYAKAAKPIYERAKRLNVNMNEVFDDPAALEAIYGAEGAKANAPAPQALSKFKLNF